MPSHPGRELGNWQMAVYALPAIPLSFLYVPLTALLPAFYATELGLGLTTVGAVLLLSRILDLVVDPVIGRLSDTVRTRHGRRKTWMVAGAPLMMAGAALVFLPPQGVGGVYLFFSTTVIYAGASMFGLAYSAWGAEIVETYHGRARIAGFREGANVLGIVIASSIPAITATYGHGVDRHTMGLLGAAIIVVTPLLLLAALLGVPEPPAIARPHVPWLQSARTVLANRPFRLLCGVFIIINVGASVTNATLIFFIQHYLQRPDVIGPTLLASFISVLLCVPLWVRISRHIGKHRAAAYSLLGAITLNVLLVLRLEPGDGASFVGLMALLGGVGAAFLTLPIGIVGDVIDYDTLKTGGARGGLFFGVWSLFQKLAPAIAIGVILPMLAVLGFDPTRENDAETLRVLKLVYGLGPVPFFFIGALGLLRFPIDSRRHDIIRRRLEQRRVRAARAAGMTAPGPADWR